MNDTLEYWVLIYLFFFFAAFLISYENIVSEDSDPRQRKGNCYKALGIKTIRDTLLNHTSQQLIAEWAGNRRLMIKKIK